MICECCNLFSGLYNKNRYIKAHLYKQYLLNHLGILFAPDKGSATRKKISKKGEEYADEFGEKYNEFITGIKNKFVTAKEEAVQLAENGKAKAEEIAAAAKNRM